MATKIEWTDETWNPVRGCTRVSPGCSNCFAERTCARNLPGLKSPMTGESFAIMTSSGPRWKGKVELIESRLRVPFHWPTPRMVFVNSMSDLFHPELPDKAIDRIFAVMALCPQHTFQVLTKHSDRMLAYMTRDNLDFRLFDAVFSHIGPSNLSDELVQEWCRKNRVTRKEREHRRSVICDGGGFNFFSHNWPLRNVWMGVSIEDRPRKMRILDLCATPAAVRFLSIEPLLEDIGCLNLNGIDWVIVGAETGPRARPFDLDWARSIVEQCSAAGVACFVKQVGGRRAIPPDLQIRQFPKPIAARWRAA